MKTIKVKIKEFDEKVLEHELLIEVQQWVQDALNGKINSVKKRLVREAQDRLFVDPEIESIPATTEGLIQTYFDRDYYKNRKQKTSTEESS